MRKMKSQIIPVLLSSIVLYGIYRVSFYPINRPFNASFSDRRQNVLSIQEMPPQHDKSVNTRGINTPYGDEIVDVINAARKINDKPILVTLINRAYLIFALSWLCNTKNMDIHKQVLIITTDNDTKKSIRNEWPNINIVAISGMPLNGDQVYSHAGYVKLTNFRAHVLLELLLINKEIFLFEVDALWMRNPVPTLSNTTGYDILANPVAERPGIIAIGFLYLFPTAATISTWMELNRRLYKLDKQIAQMPPGQLLSEADNDQIYLSNVVNQRIGGLKTKELPLDLFADGKWYNYTESKRRLSKPYVINNNWVIGNTNKLQRAIKWGHWFLHKDNKTCNYDQVGKIVQL